MFQNALQCIAPYSDSMISLLSRFYTYGDLPLESHLEAINNQALKHFEKIDAKTDIPSEPRWTSSVSIPHLFSKNNLQCSVHFVVNGLP